MGVKITGLPGTTSLADDDLIPAVDVSDTTNQPTGETKKITKANLLAGVGTGNVVGPASAVNNNFAVFDGTTGKLIKDGGNAIDGGTW